MGVDAPSRLIVEETLVEVAGQTSVEAAGEEEDVVSVVESDARTDAELSVVSPIFTVGKDCV